MKASLSLSLALLGSTAYAGLLQDLAPRQSSNWTVGQSVKTSSGTVSGHAAKNASAVSEYLGIPFGKAPIGDLRFAAPVKFEGTAPLNGSSYGYSCPVRSSGGSGLPSAEAIDAANATAVGIAVSAIFSNSAGKYSEDCLNLNIWTKPQTGDAKKAVLLWIYGGGFTSGSSAIPGYNGANIVEQEDVIVVSINYRLNILGFPGNPKSTDNLALLDQRLAVEWVRDNIANFGGDVDRITLFGQSAGGASVDLYSYAWKDDPIAAGFIPESGNTYGWGLPNSQERSASFWYNVTATLKCGNADSDADELLSCMRKQNYSDILQAVPQLGATAGILGGFGPTVDDKVVFSNYSERTPAKIPMLIGNNNYEAGYFRLQFALNGIFYSDNYWDAFNLIAFTCPTGLRANASAADGIPTWRYRYFGIFPNLAISDDAGTWHAAELALLFDTTPLNPAATEAEISIGKYMRGAWATFAKNPTTGLSDYGWPQYDPAKDTLVRLAYENITGPNLINPYRYDADCVFVNVSNTNYDPNDVPDLPDLGAAVTPTATGSGSGSTPTATGSGSGSTTSAAPVATTSGNAASKLGAVGLWAGLGAAFAVGLL